MTELVDLKSLGIWVLLKATCIQILTGKTYCWCRLLLLIIRRGGSWSFLCSGHGRLRLAKEDFSTVSVWGPLKCLALILAYKAGRALLKSALSLSRLSVYESRWRFNVLSRAEGSSNIVSHRSRRIKLIRTLSNSCHFRGVLVLLLDLIIPKSSCLRNHRLLLWLVWKIRFIYKVPFGARMLKWISLSDKCRFFGGIIAICEFSVHLNSIVCKGMAWRIRFWHTHCFNIGNQRSVILSLQSRTYFILWINCLCKGTFTVSFFRHCAFLIDFQGCMNQLLVRYRVALLPASSFVAYMSIFVNICVDFLYPVEVFLLFCSTSIVHRF